MSKVLGVILYHNTPVAIRLTLYINIIYKKQILTPGDWGILKRKSISNWSCWTGDVVSIVTDGGVSCSKYLSMTDSPYFERGKSGRPAVESSSSFFQGSTRSPTVIFKSLTRRASTVPFFLDSVILQELIEMPQERRNIFLKLGCLRNRKGLFSLMNAIIRSSHIILD